MEHNIFNSTKELNLDILKQILEYLDLEYKNSEKRKEKYYVQQTRERTLITSIADSYLRNKMIDEFKLLVNAQIEKYPDQNKDMIKVQNFLIDNIEGIINQKHPLYKCPCSMEGHISNKYAKFITSRPHSYSEDGLENMVQLLTMKANKIKLTEEIYSNFKSGIAIYKQLNLEKYINKFRNQANKLTNQNSKYNIENIM